MNQFFTPIQVSCNKNKKTAQTNFDVYQFQKYNEDPFQLTSTKIESLGDHRKKIIQWLKNMPISVRINILTYMNKQFATLLIKMFEEIQIRFNESWYQFAIFWDKYKGYMLNEDRLIRIIDHNILAAQKKLIKQIVIVNCFTRFDSVSVSQSLAADVDRMFDLFAVIENGVYYELTHTNYKMYQNSESPLLFYNPHQYTGSTKSLCSWFVEVVKKTISIKYHQGNNLQPEHPLSLNQQFVAIKMHQQKSKKFRKLWKNMSFDSKAKLVNQIFSLNVCQIVNEYRQNIRVCDRSFPKIRFSHPQKMSQFKRQIIQCGQANNHGIFQKLLFTKLEDTLEELATYKYQLMIDIEQTIINNEERVINIGSMKKKVKRNCNVVSKNQQKQKIVNKPYHLHTLPNQFKPITQPQQFKQSETKIVNKSKKEQIKEEHHHHQQREEYFTDKYEQECKREQLQTIRRKQLSQTTNQQSEQDDSSLAMFNKNMNNIKNSVSADKLLVSADKIKYQQCFDIIINQLIQKSNTSNKLKKLAINRIANILKIFNLSFKIFGSYACGLSLPGSDIDICVDPTIMNYFYGLFCTYRDKIIMALNFLHKTLGQYPWVRNLNLITTASVPLLTLDIDISIPHGHPSDPLFNPHHHNNFHIISIDLTIQPFANSQQQIPPHLGYQSTALVKQWLNFYENEHLSSIVLILKCILNKNNYNKTFTGGISSFSLIVWVVAFLKKHRKQNEKLSANNIKDGNKNQDSNREYSKKILVEQFCSFVSKFEYQKYLIDLSNHENSIVLNGANFIQSKLIVLNPLNKKNLTQNCYKIDDIKQLMKNVINIVSDTKNKTPKQYKKTLRKFFLQQ